MRAIAGFLLVDLAIGGAFVADFLLTGFADAAFLTAFFGAAFADFLVAADLAETGFLDATFFAGFFAVSFLGAGLLAPFFTALDLVAEAVFDADFLATDFDDAVFFAEPAPLALEDLAEADLTADFFLGALVFFGICKLSGRGNLRQCPAERTRPIRGYQRMVGKSIFSVKLSFSYFR